MGVKVTGQFEPAGDFSIVDGADVSGNITGSNISSSGELEASSLGTNLSSIISGSTPFGFYDSDSDFQSDAPKFATWCAKRLGYPITAIELQDTQFYACYLFLPHVVF